MVTLPGDIVNTYVPCVKGAVEKFSLWEKFDFKLAEKL